MKSVEFGKKIKELTGANNLEAALAAVEQSLNGASEREGLSGTPPGFVLIMDADRGGRYSAIPFGVNGLSDVQLVKGACQHFIISQLDSMIDQLKEREIRERIEAELARKVEGDSTDNVQ